MFINSLIVMVALSAPPETAWGALVEESTSTFGAFPDSPPPIKKVVKDEFVGPPKPAKIEPPAEPKSKVRPLIRPFRHKEEIKSLRSDQIEEPRPRYYVVDKAGNRKEDEDIPSLYKWLHEHNDNFPPSNIMYSKDGRKWERQNAQKLNGWIDWFNDVGYKFDRNAEPPLDFTPQSQPPLYFQITPQR